MNRKIFMTAAILLLLSGPGYLSSSAAGVWSDIKEDMKDMKEDIKTGTKQTGKDIKETGKEVGTATKKKGGEIKEGTKESAKSFKDGIKDLFAGDSGSKKE